MTERLDTVVRQEQIARAALRLMASRGLEGVNMAGLARQVGVVPSAIYRHFPNKDAVIDAVLDLVREQLSDNLRVAALEVSDAPGRLQRLLRLHLAMLKENQGLLRVIFSEAVSGGPASRRSKVFRTIQAYLDGIADLVREGQRAGTLRADVEPRAVAMLFLGVVQPVALLRVMSGGMLDGTAQAESAWALVRRGIEA